MAKTIEQIQQMITDKYDVREIINELTDYIQANPSSPGGGGVQSVTGSLVDNADPENPAVNIPGDAPLLQNFDVISGDPDFNTDTSEITSDGSNAFIYAQSGASFSKVRCSGAEGSIKLDVTGNVEINSTDCHDADIVLTGIGTLHVSKGFVTGFTPV